MVTDESITHIMVVFPKNNSECMFRACDGVQIGQRKNALVVYGEEPNKKVSRILLDDEYAKKFLMESVTKEDMKQHEDARPINIETRQGEGLIELPQGAIDFPQRGAHPFKN